MRKRPENRAAGTPSIAGSVLAWGLVLGAGGLGLGGCTDSDTRPPAEITARPTSWTALAGLEGENWRGVMAGLEQQCRHLATLPPNAALGGVPSLPYGRLNADWAGACAALPMAGSDGTVIRNYVQRWFQPYVLTDRALLTGYYEPQVAASLTRQDAFQVPVYRRPPDLQRARMTNGQSVFGRWQGPAFVPYDSRAMIDAGSLAGKGLELAWVRDPVDLFFLQIQGSGRLVLADGTTIRVGYDGKNGQPYVPIGRVLERRGALARNAVNADTIRAWLAAHPQEVRGVLESNPSYVFFRLLSDPPPVPAQAGGGVNEAIGETDEPEEGEDRPASGPGRIPRITVPAAAEEGSPGAFGVPLTAGRSMAIDRRYVPFAAPVWVETQVPDPRTGGLTPWRHIVFAQDTGTDIRGPGRADLFMGHGPLAPWIAGHLRSAGRMVVLVPLPPARPQ
ncbi:murein transglycosylase A [Oecophyllibacter saccharovorans]|uniref:murein transglycosylase A n=1 Tax=Oecophyllibacter saccharovorans TaxID=2558360 RepID=UPI001E5D6C23|nr:murein transglycosylase A [Oecophyllibacter saccharovorans]